MKDYRRRRDPRNSRPRENFRRARTKTPVHAIPPNALNPIANGVGKGITTTVTFFVAVASWGVGGGVDGSAKTSGGNVGLAGGSIAGGGGSLICGDTSPPSDTRHHPSNNRRTPHRRNIVTPPPDPSRCSSPSITDPPGPRMDRTIAGEILAHRRPARYNPQVVRRDL
jgi:hypothetical protein